MPLAVASAVALALSYVLDWLHYLRLLGVLGLLTASLWTPWVLNRWRQRQSEYLHRWNKRNTESANELQATNPTYDPDGFRLWMKVWLTLRSIIVVVFALMLVFCMSFVLITVDNSLVTVGDCFEISDARRRPNAVNVEFCIRRQELAGLSQDVFFQFDELTDAVSRERIVG